MENLLSENKTVFRFDSNVGNKGYIGTFEE
jgi:hypothetical protein